MEIKKAIITKSKIIHNCEYFRNKC